VPFQTVIETLKEADNDSELAKVILMSKFEDGTPEKKDE